MLVSTIDRVRAQQIQPGKIRTDLCADLSNLNLSPSGTKKYVRRIIGDNRRRISLIIGNNYSATAESTSDDLRPLKNAVQDAIDVASLFDKLGYAVVCLINSESHFIKRALIAISSIKSKESGALTFFYFSGHGFSHSGTNYLVGEGAQRNTVGSLTDESLEDFKVLQRLRSREAPVVTIFDMCRTKISLSSDEGVKSLGKDVLDTFAYTKEKRGIIIHYAASPGGYANDMPDFDNGLYASVFLDELKKPSIDLYKFFNESIGLRLLNGVKREKEGIIKLYRQTPNLVTDPNEWSKISLYDVTNKSRLERHFALVPQIEQMSLTAGNFACKSAVELLQYWSNVKYNPEKKNPFKITVRDLVNKLNNLIKKINTISGVTCPAKETQIADSFSVYVPPFTHRLNANKSLKKVSSENTKIFTKGTWIATEASKIGVTLGDYGIVHSSRPTGTNLAIAYATQNEGFFKGLHPAFATPVVYQGMINRNYAKLTNSEDQVVLRFDSDSWKLVNKEHYERQMVDFTNLVKSIPSSKILITLAPTQQGPVADLQIRRLSLGRVITVINRIIKAGVERHKIIWPDLDNPPSLSLSTVGDNEMLLKITNFANFYIGSNAEFAKTQNLLWEDLIADEVMSKITQTRNRDRKKLILFDSKFTPALKAYYKATKPRS